MKDFIQPKQNKTKKINLNVPFKIKIRQYYIMHWLDQVCNFVFKIAYNGFRAMKNILE
jgi:hypothetical protein